MSTKNAAEALGITLRTLYSLINDGQLPAYKIGRVLRVRHGDIEAFLAGAKVKPGALDHLLPLAGRAAVESRSKEGKKKPRQRR